MSLIELFVLAVGLSMDAFAVSMCKGLALKKATPGAMIKAGAYFGGFQAGMPLIGYFLGQLFSKADLIQRIDHWIAFVLLVFIGGNMLKEAFSKCCECENHTDSLSVKTMFPMAVATSIDALALGISPLGTTPDTNILLAVSLIGIVTCAVCTVGVKISNILGSRYEKRAQFLGGAILVLLGIVMLVRGLLE